ncbi:MAG: hypothetical protein J0M02_09135 [Planctomycetes bacterium]|nr:hypothetical protein [Planctomycetota bacterium]
MHLLKRTPAGLVDLGLGRRRLTFIGTVCLVGQLLGSDLLVGGIGMATDEMGPGLSMAGIGLAVVVVATAVHLPVLRHAYRRRVDLIPPALRDKSLADAVPRVESTHDPLPVLG